MEDIDKSQRELIKELTALRQRVTELDTLSSPRVRPNLEIDNVTRTAMDSKFIGREVSCRYLGVFFQELQKKGLPPETLTAGVDFSLEHLRNKNERIDWSSYRTLMANAGKIWSDEELVGIGRTFVTSPWAEPFNVVAKLLFTATDFYRWASQTNSRGTGAFTCVQTSYRELESNLSVTELTMQKGYEPRREVFLVAKGTMIALPTVLGLRPARVDMEEIEGGARYTIQVPPGGGTLAWLRKAITWPFMARAAAYELREAHEVLQERYMELETQIAERKRAEERLKHTLGEMQAIFDAFPDLLFRVDSQGTILDYRTGAKSDLYVPPEQFLHKPIAEFLPADVSQLLNETIAQALEQGSLVGVEYSLSGPTGEQYFEGRVIPLTNDQVIFIARNISERKQAEERLRYQADLLQSVSDAIIATDTAFKIESWNRAAEAMYGWQSDEVIGKPIGDVIQTEYLNGQSEEVLEQFLEKGFWSGEVIQKRKGGRAINILSSVTMLRDSAGNRVGAVAANRDITDRKQAEEALREYSERLEEMVAERTKELRDIQDRLIRQEKLATIGQMGASIAHELRNPLGAIKQSGFYLQSLHEQARLNEANPKVKEHLALIEAEIGTADRVISDFLEATRMRSTQQERIDLRIIIREAAERVKFPAQIQLELDLKPDPFLIWADLLQLRRVFVNLLTNAYQACAEDGRVTISVQLLPDKAQAQILIQDNGRGVDAESLERVFEPLFTTKAKGTGLGLTICRQIIEAHDGSIALTSQIDQGAVVEIVLPHPFGAEVNAPKKSI